MTQVESYIAENERYLSESNAAALARISDHAWPAVIQALEALNGGSEPGIDCSVAITHDTLADFEAAARDYWRECARTAHHEFCGLAAVKYEGVQVAKGDQRRDMIVIDAGGYRVALRY